MCFWIGIISRCWTTYRKNRRLIRKICEVSKAITSSLGNSGTGKAWNFARYKRWSRERSLFWYQQYYRTISHISRIKRYQDFRVRIQKRNNAIYPTVVFVERSFWGKYCRTKFAISGSGANVNFSQKHKNKFREIFSSLVICV